MFRGVILCAALALASTASAATLPYATDVHRLANGLRLVLVPTPSPAVVAYSTVIRVGMRDETSPESAGFSRILGRLMSRGTAAWPAERFDALMARAAGEYGRTTTDDYTRFTFLGASEDLETVMRVESDRLRSLAYSYGAFEAEAAAMSRDDGARSHLLHAYVRRRVFREHPYGRLSFGSSSEGLSMAGRYEASLAFFAKHYTPDRISLVVVGGFDKTSVIRWAEAYYGSWAGRSEDVMPRQQVRRPRPTRGHLESGGYSTPMLSFGWRTPRTNYDSKDTAVHNLAFELCFGVTAPLYRELVLDTRLVLGFEEWSQDHRDPYLFHVVARLASARYFDRVEAMVFEEVARIARGEIDERRLESVKLHVRGSMILAAQGPSQIARQVADGIGVADTPDGMERLLDTIAEVTVDDVERFARLYLGASGRSVVSFVGAGE